MTPFIGTPEDFSAETLELLDRALLAMWRDRQMQEIADLHEVREPVDDKEAPA